MDWHIKWPVLLLSFFAFVLTAAGEQQKPHFPKKKIVIDKITLEVEVAETNSQLSYGLMYREKLSDDQGMLFVFGSPEIRSFWMKNTFIDLSIGYFDQNKTLFQIIDMKATNLMQKDFPSYVSSGPAQFALEVPKGWFGRRGVKIGDKFKWR